MALVNAPRVEGMVPVKELAWRRNVSRTDRYPSDEGMIPLNEFADTSKILSLPKYPSVLGIVPVRQEPCSSS